MDELTRHIHSDVKWHIPFGKGIVFYCIVLVDVVRMWRKALESTVM